MRQNKNKQHKHQYSPDEGEQAEYERELSSTFETAEEELQLAAEQKKTEECLDLLRRTQADFVNYRRRMSKEIQVERDAARRALLAQLLPVLDDLRRALEMTPSNSAWGEGLILIARRLTTLFDQLGVRPIGTSGEPFDPRRHEALTTEARTDLPDGTIAQVVQPGYALGEQVIRPAQVSVARTPVPEQPEGSDR